MLEVRDLVTGYGDVPILRGVSLTVDEGEVVALLGANAAGKTTLMRCLSGFLPAFQGDILLDGVSVTALPPHDRARKGLVQVPEGRHLFPMMTVRENIEMGAFPPRKRQGLAERLERMWDLFPEIKDRQNQCAGFLSGGEQQMVAIARALMAQPRLLLLDEPSQGLAPRVVQRIFEVVEQIHRQGTTILLVEQDVMRALSMAQRGYVLENGKIVLEGTGPQLLGNPELRRAYLGI